MTAISVLQWVSPIFLGAFRCTEALIRGVHIADPDLSPPRPWCCCSSACLVSSLGRAWEQRARGRPIDGRLTIRVLLLFATPVEQWYPCCSCYIETRGARGCRNCDGESSNTQSTGRTQASGREQRMEIKLLFSQACSLSCHFVTVNMSIKRIPRNLNFSRLPEMLRVWCSQSPMGFGNVWHMDMSWVFRKAQRPRRTLVLRPFRIDGQVERPRTRKNESRWKRKRQNIPRIPARLGRFSSHIAKVQYQGSRPLQTQGKFNFPNPQNSSNSQNCYFLRTNYRSRLLPKENLGNPKIIARPITFPPVARTTTTNDPRTTEIPIKGMRALPARPTEITTPRPSKTRQRRFSRGNKTKMLTGPSEFRWLCRRAVSRFFLWLILCSLFRNVPPNQGGKYSGFGYQMDASPMPKSSSQEFFDTAVSSLASVNFFLL